VSAPSPGPQSATRTAPKIISTKASDIEFPKLRKGSFFATILEPRRRIDQALCAVVMEA
jgi:transposase-like protein